MNQHFDDRLDVLDRRSCLGLLATATVGRIAWTGQDGRVEIRLVNIALDGEDVLIRCEPGMMLGALHTGRAVAVEADVLEPALRTGWTVVVTGSAAEVEAGPQAERLVGLVQPWAGGERRHLIRVRADQVTGRRLRLTAGGSTIVALEPRTTDKRSRRESALGAATRRRVSTTPMGPLVNDTQPHGASANDSASR